MQSMQVTWAPVNMHMKAQRTEVNNIFLFIFYQARCVCVYLNFHQTNIDWIHSTWRGCIFLVFVYRFMKMSLSSYNMMIRPYSISQHESFLQCWNFPRCTASMLDSLRMPLSHFGEIQQGITDETTTKNSPNRRMLCNYYWIRFNLLNILCV